MNRHHHEAPKGKYFSVLRVFITITVFLISCSPSPVTPVVPATTFTTIPLTSTLSSIPSTATATNTLVPSMPTENPATSTPLPDRFAFVTSPLDPNIKMITLADVNSGDYAKWLDDWHHCDAPISQYTYFMTADPGSFKPNTQIGLDARDHSTNILRGYMAKDTAHCGIAIFKPSEFNLKSPKGKELDDLYLVTYQYTGPQDERTYVNTLLSKKALDKLIADGGMKPETQGRITPVTYLDKDGFLVDSLTNGDTNGDGIVEDSGDFRGLNDIIYTMQNVPGIKGPQDVFDLYQSIATKGLNVKFKDTGLRNRDILNRLVGLGVPMPGPRIRK
jgi:hypothetical protein